MNYSDVNIRNMFVKLKGSKSLLGMKPEPSFCQAVA